MFDILGYFEVDAISHRRKAREKLDLQNGRCMSSERSELHQTRRFRN